MGKNLSLEGSSVCICYIGKECFFVDWHYKGFVKIVSDDLSYLRLGFSLHFRCEGAELLYSDTKIVGSLNILLNICSFLKWEQYPGLSSLLSLPIPSSQLKIIGCHIYRNMYLNSCY